MMKPLFHLVPTFSLPALVVLCLLTFSIYNNVSAQTEKAVYNKKYAIGVSTGLKSIFGIDGGVTLTPRFNIRTGFQYADLKYKDPDFAVEESSRHYNVDVRYQFSHFELLGEYAPLSFLRLVFGAGFFFKNTGYIFVTPGEDTQFNDVVLTPEEIGYVKATTHYPSPFAPYLGIALGKLVPGKRLSLSCDLGAFYKGSTTVDIEASELLSENTRNEPILDRNLKPYQFFPNVALRLGIRLN